MKIGAMGGTFDPIHLGHLAIAEEARQRLSLNEVIFIPAGRPYFKDLSTISPAEDRVNMVKLAIAGQPYYRISMMEIERSGPSYAVDTIAKIRSQMGKEDEIFFIMGWDSILTLYQWFEAGRLIKLCRIVAAPRPGYPPPDVKSLEKNLPGISQRTIIMDKPLVDISATEIRQRVSRGHPIYHLVPVAVARYISEHGLYKGQR